MYSPRRGLFRLSLFSSRTATFLPPCRGITGTWAFVPFLWLCQFYFWKQYGEMLSVLKGPLRLLPRRLTVLPWQTLSNVEMTFFTIISPRPFLYKAGHLCVLTLCKTQCSFWTTLCCEPLAIAAFPAGFLPSQHRLVWPRVLIEL